MDSNDQERERGITILAKAASVTWQATSGSTSSTRPATPTSAARSSGPWPWSTACCCSSTPPRGPLPQTRYVLSKALAARPARPWSCSTRSTASDARRRRGARRDLPAVPRPRRRRPRHRVPDHLGRRPRGPGDRRASACPADDDDLTAAVRGASSTTVPAPDRRPRRRRSRRSSPTSTPPTTSAASPSAGSCGARCARATRSRCSTRRSTRASTR